MFFVPRYALVYAPFIQCTLSSAIARRTRRTTSCAGFGKQQRSALSNKGVSALDVLDADYAKEGGAVASKKTLHNIVLFIDSRRVAECRGTDRVTLLGTSAARFKHFIGTRTANILQLQVAVLADPA